MTKNSICTTGEKRTTLLKKPIWDPHGTHVETMWVSCGNLVGPSGNHVGTMWDLCEKLLRDPIGNHAVNIWEPYGSHVDPT